MSLTIEEIQARRAELREANDRAREAQRITDMGHVLDLEETLGFEAVLVTHLQRWSDGAATLVVCEVPRAKDNRFKRFQQVANSDKAKAAKKVEASEQLARSCLLYPHPKDEAELCAATLDVAPGLLGFVANELVKAVQGREEDEGK